MGEPSQEVRELLVGTWTGVALIVETLIRADAVRRDDLLRLLGEAGALAKDRRRIALIGMRKLITPGFGESAEWPTPSGRRQFTFR